MNISKWSVEDFVLDPGFKDWVLYPRRNNSVLWKEHLERNPEKLEEIKQAREILLNLSSKSFKISKHDKNDLWAKIEEEVDHYRSMATGPGKIIPINSYSTIRRKEKEKNTGFHIPQFYRVAGILLICFALSFLASKIMPQQKVHADATPLEYAEHVTHPGVKSSLTLSDGTKVILNSGSKIYYEKYFRGDKREVFLEGEAQFNVFKDPGKPFTVHTGNISTTALGTSFNINAYEGEKIGIYLLSGKVMVMDKNKSSQFAIQLAKGEAAQANLNGDMSTEKFEEEKVTAWTKGIIVFDQTPVLEAIRILENWYGVNFDLSNKPIDHLTVSGKFDNETLKNILIGLSYSARFKFEIINNSVKIDFIK